MISETDIARLTRAFYARVRHDETLGPIFAQKIADDDAAWARHIAHINTFWSSLFLNSRSFQGNPLLKHIALSGLTPAHFTRWLELFSNTAQDVLAPQQASEFELMAGRIAQSLQMGLAFHHAKTDAPAQPFQDYSPVMRGPRKNKPKQTKTD